MRNLGKYTRISHVILDSEKGETHSFSRLRNSTNEQDQTVLQRRLVQCNILIVSILVSLLCGCYYCMNVDPTPLALSQPHFTTDSLTDIDATRSIYLSHLEPHAPVKYSHKKNDSIRLNKRDTIIITQTTSSLRLKPSFIIDVVCIPSIYIYNTRPSQAFLNNVCDRLKVSVERGAKRLAQVLLLKETVKVSLTFQSFCGSSRTSRVDQQSGRFNPIESNTESKGSRFQSRRFKKRHQEPQHAPPPSHELPLTDQFEQVKFSSKSQDQQADASSTGSNACASSDQTLAKASPYSFHIFTPDSAKALGVDSDFYYPSALAKQYAPNDQVFANSTEYDLSAAFNADFSWWFTGTFGDDIGENKRARGNSGLDALDGSGGEKSAKQNVYDFEQIMIHEFLHGLGMISNWGPFRQQYFIPGDFIVDPLNNIIRGLTPTYLYDRLLVDTMNRVWMNDYNKAIMDAAYTVSMKLNTSNINQWLAEFDKTDGGQISRYLYNMTSVSLQSIAYWFPQDDYFKNYGKPVQMNPSALQRDEPGMKQAVVYTPFPFSGGSSLSHLDAKLYEGTSEFLMRPFGTPGIGMDAFTPQGRYGPVGELVLGILRSMGYVTSKTFL